MAQQGTIEWTDAAWNPVRGCSTVSPGCAHCYAERFAERWRGLAGHPYERGFEVRLVEEQLAAPFRWTRPRRVLVSSTSDLFHERVPIEYVVKVFGVMELADWHVFQVLTKRAARMRKVVGRHLHDLESFPHVWLGVSVEDRKHGLPRIEALRRTPAALRFLQIEPLLEDLGAIDLGGIDWVIVGGETGPGARPMQREWVVSIRKQCKAAGVPFFFKEWGGVRRNESGRELDGRTYGAMPRLKLRDVPRRPERRQRMDQLALR
jgi:protein gp37